MGGRTPTLRSYVDPLADPARDRTGRRRRRHRRFACGRAVSGRIGICRPLRLWGYNGHWPGPTIEVRRGRALTVNWINELPTRHFLPIDPTIHGAHGHAPEVRTDRSRARRAGSSRERRVSGSLEHVGWAHRPAILAEPICLSQRAAGVDALVSRPRAGHHPPERVRGTRRALSDPRRRGGRAESAARAIRDSAVDSGPELQCRRLLALSAGARRHTSDVDAGVFRRDDLRQRQGDAVSRRRAAAISLPDRQRLQLPLLSLDAAARRCARQTVRIAGRTRRRSIRSAPTADCSRSRWSFIT